jgi:hypothetical protein
MTNNCVAHTHTQTYLTYFLKTFVPIYFDIIAVVDRNTFYSLPRNLIKLSVSHEVLYYLNTTAYYNSGCLKAFDSITF